MLADLYRYCIFLEEEYTVVSSVTTIALLYWRRLGKSLVYMMNNKGPNTEPCGTPYVMVSVCEFD